MVAVPFPFLQLLAIQANQDHDRGGLEAQK